MEKLKSNVFITKKSFDRFRLLQMSRSPILTCNSYDQSSLRCITYSKLMAVSTSDSFSPLIDFLDHNCQATSLLGAVQFPTLLTATDIYKSEVVDFLGHMILFCSERAVTSHSSFQESCRLCGAFLVYIINSSAAEDQNNLISTVVFSLSEGILAIMKEVDFLNISDSERQNFDRELIYVISISCSLLLQVISKAECTQMRDFNGTLGECHEILSWAVSLACSVSEGIQKSPQDEVTPALNGARNITTSEKHLHIDTGDQRSKLEINSNLSNVLVGKRGINTKNCLSDFQLAFDNCFLSPLFWQNNDSYSSVLGTLCSEYLATVLPYQNTEFTATPVNFRNVYREVYGQQVDCVFCPISSPHRTAIIAWSKYSQNSKAFNSMYVLQCTFIHSLNLLLRAEECSDDIGPIDKDDVTDENEDNNDVLHKNVSSKESKNVNCRMRRDEAYSLITISALRMFRTAPDLFLRILCDSASCSLEINFREKQNILNENISSTNSCNFYSTSLQIILKILTESLKNFGGTVSMILSSTLKICNSQNTKGCNEKHPPNPGVIPLFSELVKELESGFLAGTLMLYFITDDLRSQEVRQCLMFL